MRWTICLQRWPIIAVERRVKDGAGDTACLADVVDGHVVISDALDDLFATLANNCAKAGIIDTEEPPDLLSRIATDLVCHELYVWCSQKGNFSLRARARQYAEVAYHVKPEYRMPAEQRDAL